MEGIGPSISRRRFQGTTKVDDGTFTVRALERERGFVSSESDATAAQFLLLLPVFSPLCSAVSAFAGKIFILQPPDIGT